MATESMERKKYSVLLAVDEAIIFERKKRVCWKPLRICLLYPSSTMCGVHWGLSAYIFELFFESPSLRFYISR
jgi:hypothetical protein